MKIKMSGAWWLVICSTIYMIAEGIAIFGYHQTGHNSLTVTYIQMVWMFVMSLPLWIPPLSRFCNIKLLWE